MKKTYPTSQHAKEWRKHLKPEGKRTANKSTRRILKVDVKEIDIDDFLYQQARGK